MEFALGHVCRKSQSLEQKPSTSNGMLPERTTKTTFSNLFIIIEVEGEIQTDKDISLICLSNELDNQCGVNQNTCLLIINQYTLYDHTKFQLL